MDKALIVCDAPKGIEFFRDFLMQNDYKEITVVDSGEKPDACWSTKILICV